MNAQIEKLVFGGQALGKTPDGKLAFVWGALPDETVELDIIKDKKNLIEANAQRIIAPSAHRIAPQESHYLSCSPWQILAFDQENEWKIDIARETYTKIGGLNDTALDIVANEEAQYHYRNKIEYSFAETPAGMALSFFERGRRQHIPLSQCDLASLPINNTAQTILAWINEQHIPLRSLKSLIVRSNLAGQTIAGLFIKDRLPFPSYPKLTDTFIGFQLFYSTHKSPASVPTDLLHSAGTSEVTETIRGTKLTYGIFSFFQINVPLFEHALEDIATHLDPSLPIVDFYSGVGAIGIPLAKQQPLTMVEINADAVNFTKENVKMNGLKHAEAILSPSEKAISYISEHANLILDPPREGLHGDVVKKILEVKPKKIMYLSCNLSTHARDLALLTPLYNITFLRLYNFFPRTPHIESLAVLERK